MTGITRAQVEARLKDRLCWKSLRVGGSTREIDLCRSWLRLHDALKHAKEWLEESGCNCGTDEPGTCALCETQHVLSEIEETKETP